MEYFTTQRRGIPTPLTAKQVSLKFQTDVTVSGRSVAIISLTDPDTGNTYTVPSGYRLVIGVSIISCKLSVWQHTALLVSQGLIGDYWFCGRGQSVFPDYAATTVEAGITPSIYVYNTDEESLDFSIAINAVEEMI